MVRDSREDWKTWQGVFDAFTLRALFKLSSQGHFDELMRTISPGKEAMVFVARKGAGMVAVKVYKLETAKFSKMFPYLRVDPRYHALKNNQRQVVFSWTEREYRNLLIAREAGLRVPTPIAHFANVLVMEYIGGSEPAPMLRAAAPEDPARFAKECLDDVERLARAGFVHGDLSEHNVLNDGERPVIIDFSHMAPLRAPNSRELLERDVLNMCAYFRKHGVDTDEKAMLARMLAAK